MRPISAALTPSSPSRTIELRRRLPDGSAAMGRNGRTRRSSTAKGSWSRSNRSAGTSPSSGTASSPCGERGRYRALVETQTEFVLRQLPDGRLTFVNEAYCRYVGKPREQMLDASWNDLD